MRAGSRETGYQFAGKRVLDAGTGTGHRLIEAASALQDTQFVAVDVSEASLAIARATAARAGVGNIDFRICDLMEAGTPVGTFDVVLCMGVLHHLSDPGRGLRSLVRSLANDGILFLYLYGRLGSVERMRRKKIVDLLLGKRKEDYPAGIQMVEDLGFDSFMYGYPNCRDPQTLDGHIVDAYLNANETLYDVDDIFDLMKGSGLHAVMTYGLTVERKGYLFDARAAAPSAVLPNCTSMGKLLTSPLLAEAYAGLDLKDRYRLVDLFYQPNGYTLLGYKAGATKLLGSDRVMANSLPVSDL